MIPCAVPGPLTRVLSLLRTHLGFSILLGTGLLLRILVLVAYPAAFWFPDSSRYLEFSRGWRLDFMRQGGYSLLLKALRPTDNLFTVSILQHLIGLAVAVGLYALLVRRGLPHWLAVLGVAPIVLDAYELTVEHFVLSDTLFIGFVVAGLLALLWPRRPTVGWAAAAGLLLAASSTVRVVSVALVLATVGYLLVRKAGWRAVTAFALAVAVVFGGYATWFRLSNGTFGFSAFGPTFLYGRVAPFADCERLRLTADERRLCPTQPVGVRPSRADFYVWDEQSPVRGVPLETQESFVYKVFTQQPVDTVGAMLRETGLYLVPHHDDPDDTCAADAMRLTADTPTGPDYSWCQPNPRQEFRSELVQSTLPQPSPLTRALGGYADVVSTPRLLLLLSVLLGLAGLVWRPRRTVDGAPTSDIALLTMWGLGLLLLTSTAATLDERYALPSIAILPPVAALAAYRLWSLRTGPPPPPSPRS